MLNEHLHKQNQNIGDSIVIEATGSERVPPDEHWRSQFDPSDVEPYAYAAALIRCLQNETVQLKIAQAIFMAWQQPLRRTKWLKRSLNKYTGSVEVKYSFEQIQSMVATYVKDLPAGVLPRQEEMAYAYPAIRELIKYTPFEYLPRKEGFDYESSYDEKSALKTLRRDYQRFIASGKTV
jgi:hypothetical protein